MKKFFSYFCYVAMAVAAVSFVSCGDDDDIDDPKEPDTKEVQIYTAALGDQTLEVMDIKLNLYRNGQKQVVVLDNSMLGKYVPNVMTANFGNTLTYYCASVNGVEGVDSVIAEATAKPNIKDIVASHDPEDSFTWAGRGSIMKVEKAADGDYSKFCGPKTEHHDFWNSVFADRNGKVHYENMLAEVQTMLTAK